MTAISIVYPLQNLANAVGVGFGVGINAAVAYYLGANNGKAQTVRQRWALSSAPYTASCLPGYACF